MQSTHPHTNKDLRNQVKDEDVGQRWKFISESVVLFFLFFFQINWCLGRKKMKKKKGKEKKKVLSPLFYSSFIYLQLSFLPCFFFFTTSMP